MNQIDKRPTAKFTRLNETRDLVVAIPFRTLNSTRDYVLNDGESLDGLAYKLYGDEHAWKDIADLNTKLLLEFGFDFPVYRNIRL